MITTEHRFIIQQRANGTRDNVGWYDIITPCEFSSIGDALEYIDVVPGDPFEYRVQTVTKITEVIINVKYDYPESE
jgi:hypothetical protein